MMEGWRQQTITKHPDTRGSFASGIRPQHRPWGAPHCSLGICFPIAPLINREQFATRPQPRLWGAVHRSLGIRMTSLMNIAPAKQMLIFIIQGAQRQRNRCSTPPVTVLNSAGRGARSGAEYSREK